MNRVFPVELQKEVYKYITKDMIKELIEMTKVIYRDLTCYPEIVNKTSGLLFRIRPYWRQDHLLCWGYLHNLSPEGEYPSGNFVYISYHNIFKLKEHLRKLGLAE